MISLGVDIGGTGCKCAAFRDDGQQLAIAYAEYAIPVGSVNLAPSVLSDAVLQVIGSCVDQLAEPEDVVAITVSSFGESFVAIDTEGQPLTDILMYFGNTESQEFSRLVECIGEETFMQITKLQPVALYSLSKMLYTQKVAKRPVHKYLFIGSYICYLLSGNTCSDISLACRSLLYDVENRCWSRHLLEKTGIREENLPTVLPSGGTVGTILPEMAASLGLPRDVKIVIGSLDQLVNALGAGVSQVGDAVDTSGTCECVTPLYEKMPEGVEFQRNNFCCVPYFDDCGYATYAFNLSAGSVVRWYRDALASYLREEARQQGKSIYDLLNEQCPQEPTDLLVMPYLQGMGGTPDVDPNATGLIAGLTTQTRLPDIYRAILEGITFEMRYNQEKLQEGGIRIRQMFACGGGAKSPVWLQIKADIMGCSIIPVKCEETGAMGCAILGLAAVTGQKPFAVAQRFWRYAEPVEPDPARQAIYDQRYQRFKALRSLIIERKDVF